MSGSLISNKLSSASSLAGLDVSLVTDFSETAATCPEASEALLTTLSVEGSLAPISPSESLALDFSISVTVVEASLVEVEVSLAFTLSVIDEALVLTIVSYKLTDDRQEEELEVLNIKVDEEDAAIDVETVVVILEEPGLLACVFDAVRDVTKEDGVTCTCDTLDTNEETVVLDTAGEILEINEEFVDAVVLGAACDILDINEVVTDVVVLEAAGEDIAALIIGKGVNSRTAADKGTITEGLDTGLNDVGSESPKTG